MQLMTYNLVELFGLELFQRDGASGNYSRTNKVPYRDRANDTVDDELCRNVLFV